jgi:hypothetical protein
MEHKEKTSMYPHAHKQTDIQICKPPYRGTSTHHLTHFTGNTSNINPNSAYIDLKIIPAAGFPQSPTHSELHPQVGRVLSQGQYQQFHTSLGHQRHLKMQ